MANKASPKKVVKNIEKPRLQRQTCTVFKHFEPTIDLSACRVNLQATIPLVNVESDEEPPVAVPPKRFRAKPPRNVHVFKSSSSSSLESKVEKFCNRSKSIAGDSRRTTKARRAVKSARENASSVHASNAVVKSVTDPALIQRERNLKALKQEILVNRRPTIAQTGQDTNSPRLAALKSEIHQSRTDNVLHKKVLITELRSEIAQYKQFSKYQVYSNYEGNVAAKKEHSEPVDNSARDRRTEAGSDKSEIPLDLAKENKFSIPLQLPTYTVSKISKTVDGTGQTYHSNWFAWNTMLFLYTDQQKPDLDTPQEIEEEDDDIFIEDQNENVVVATFDESEFDNDAANLPETESGSEQLSSTPESESYDELALFGMDIAEKLRQMDQRSQITLQHKISNLLFEAEMQAVNKTLIQFRTEYQD